jgi:malate permease and related proteins
MQNFIVIAVFLALGALCKYLFALPEKAPFLINKFVINIALPAVILLKLPRLTLDKNAWLPVLTSWSIAAVLAATIFFIGRRLKWPREILGAVLLVSLYTNSSYLGFPMVRAFFGDEGLPYAIMFDQPGNFVIFAIGTPILLAIFAQQRQKISALPIIKRIFGFPPFCALLAGLALNGVSYPAVITQLLSLLELTLAPLAMFIVGLQFSWHVPAKYRQPLMLVLGLRLMISPALALTFFALTGHGELAARVTTFEAGMPTMITVAIMAIGANLSPRLCTAAVGFGLVLSMITLPLWFALTQWLL